MAAAAAAAAAAAVAAGWGAGGRACLQTQGEGWKQEEAGLGTWGVGVWRPGHFLVGQRPLRSRLLPRREQGLWPWPLGK